MQQDIENQERNARLIAISKCFRQGVIAPWYLKPKQRTVIDELRAMKDPFLEASRRFGKTTTVLVHVIEECCRHKIIARWCEPWKNQCREIVMPEMDKIQSFISNGYRFDWKATDSYYECRWNGSRIYMRGVNDDRGESARGSASHIIVADELGSWRNTGYILTEVLGPQLLTTKGKMIFMGTPPNNQTHLFYELKDKAVTERRFIQRLIYDQEIVDWDVIEEAIKRAGGWDSTAVKREYLCQKITDPKFSIIPEWKDDYIEDVPRDDLFQFYLKIDALDIGVRDLTVCLFAYYDFRRAKLIVIDEVVMNGPTMTTEKLAEAIRAKENELFGITWAEIYEGPKKRWKVEAPKHFRMRRVSDIDLLLLNDLTNIHSLYFEPTDKGYLEEMVNEVRLWVGAGRVLVNPKCTYTIDSLRYGIWDEKRNEWERSDRLGHFDALASLMYMIRNVDSRTNPIPITHGRAVADTFFTEEPDVKKDKLRKMLNPYGGLKIERGQ